MKGLLPDCIAVYEKIHSSQLNQYMHCCSNHAGRSATCDSLSNNAMSFASICFDAAICSYGISKQPAWYLQGGIISTTLPTEAAKNPQPKGTRDQ